MEKSISDSGRDIAVARESFWFILGEHKVLEIWSYGHKDVIKLKVSQTGSLDVQQEIMIKKKSFMRKGKQPIEVWFSTPRTIDYCMSNLLISLTYSESSKSYVYTRDPWDLNTIFRNVSGMKDWECLVWIVISAVSLIPVKHLRNRLLIKFHHHVQYINPTLLIKK